jgi:hypothetical protein
MASSALPRQVRQQSQLRRRQRARQAGRRADHSRLGFVAARAGADETLLLRDIWRVDMLAQKGRSICETEPQRQPVGTDAICRRARRVGARLQQQLHMTGPPAVDGP